MLKKLLIIIVFISVSANSFAQTVYDNLSVSLGNLFYITDQVMGSNRYYEYIPNGNPLFGGRVAPSGSMLMTMHMEANVQHVIMAATDRDGEVDLIVYQGSGTDGTIIDRNKFRLKGALVRFNVPVSGTYTVELINPSRETAFITMLALRVRVNQVFTLNPLLGALDNLKLVFHKRGGQSLNVAAGAFSLFGSVVSRGNSTGFTGELPSGRYELLAAGSSATSNVEAQVFQLDDPGSRPPSRTHSTNSGQNIREDYAVFPANESKTYLFRINNKNPPNNQAFIIGLIVIKP
ncbi:MAG: hypothetical protein FWD22_04690 [Treponema sp.]|nr:hypothetical protein [Treponema sp.]